MTIHLLYINQHALAESGWECISKMYKLSQDFIEHNYDKINLEAMKYNDKIPYSMDEIKNFIKNGEKAAKIETIEAVKDGILYKNTFLCRNLK